MVDALLSKAESRVKILCATYYTVHNSVRGRLPYFLQALK